jgi:hypothetical protein
VWEPHTFAGIGLIIFGNIIILARKPKKRVITEGLQGLVPLKEAA